MADRATTEKLAVFRVRNEAFDLDPPGLVHLVGSHDTDFRLATGSNLGLGRRLAHRVTPGRRLGGRGGIRSTLFDLAQAKDRLDTSDLAFRLDDLARGLEALGLALEPEAKQVRLGLA